MGAQRHRLMGAPLVHMQLPDPSTVGASPNARYTYDPSGDERGHDVGAPIEVLTPSVVDGGGARIGIPHGDLGVSLGLRFQDVNSAESVGAGNVSVAERM